MQIAVLSQPVQPKPPLVSGTPLIAAAVLAVWFALVVALGADGVFVSPPGALPLPIAAAVSAPVIAFLLALRLSRRFRQLVLSIDLRLTVGIQAWRFAGFGFLALYAYGVLPGMFALPAGIGDIAIGVTAPWLLLALGRRPRFAISRTFVAWNLLGVLDLVVAVCTGVLGSVLALGVPGELTMRPMAELPLVLIPGFLVPVFVMLHLAAWLQIRRAAAMQPG